MRRRRFLELGAALAAVPAAASAAAQGSLATTGDRAAQAFDVDFIADGRPLAPGDYAQLLMRLADEGRIRADDYSNGGIVEELEERFAALLGQESAVFVPTGTLANHLAVRRLAGSRGRVLVPADSHLYCDSGDCAQRLSGLNLVPLGAGRPCYDVADLVQAVQRSGEGRVATPVGALVVETPVRRHLDRMVRDEELRAITQFARANDIRTHLDGARIFVQSAHTGTSPADYGRAFDTVYTSLWKCFNAPSGAVLAGAKRFTAGLFHERRMFGGSLPAAWPFAAVALHFVDTFLDEYGRALARSRTLFAALERRGGVRVEHLTDGTHIVRLHLGSLDPVRLRRALAVRGVRVPEGSDGIVLLRINPTLADAPADLETRFLEALAEAA
ncbi:MAG: beta-eliminating lyase-related protein [Pseudomonadota bacterium]|jgi:Threonine aldolase|nr:MAG: amino acid lyase [Pseudomonadota bacterium]